jgi:deazaflavin-dependent oxidoreductase (nitroreductase family)
LIGPLQVHHGRHERFQRTDHFEFRANAGHVGTAGFGDGLVLLHTIGARSGDQRINPLAAIRQPDGSWLIAGSAAGGPKNPDWYANLLALPEVEIEVGDAGGEGGIETVPVTARDLGGDERDTGWAQFTSMSSGFADYESTAAPRRIPVVQLSPR